MFFRMYISLHCITRPLTGPNSRRSQGRRGLLRTCSINCQIKPVEFEQHCAFVTHAFYEYSGIMGTREFP